MAQRRPTKQGSPQTIGSSLSAETAINHIKERFGEGAIMRLGEAKIMAVEVLPTDCLSLDLALGAGGLPRGRIIEIYGPEASGKTISTSYSSHNQTPANRP
ncbi:MAG: Protein RecA [Candidatus Giovannonibacteria bacterium GW2011_GWA2_53_7]|uniref:Protein RecA n=1 Tax=Candidatus Giovannonibacteria bacterium GW2011_GWA2_53_7 TaxID=1618650 RepID=A0A0G1XUR5_9BACT|nr:MAG: Protein RecA [Candidatus Giovannonibacteria bacterium GW2011_GWA2_53_7]